MQPNDWNLMLYVAADNDLTDAASPSAASDDVLAAAPLRNIDVFAEIDTSQGDTTTHWHLPGGSIKAHQKEVADTDSGDYRTLIAFVKSSRRHVRSKRDALVIWSHGAGLGRMGDAGSAANDCPECALAAGDSLFRSSEAARFAADLFSGIAPDVGTQHVIDNLDLHEALDAMHDSHGQPLDVIVFQACIMSTIEILYQLRRHVRFVVGAQAAIPATPAAYGDVLKALNADSDMRPRELAMLIAEKTHAAWAANEEISEASTISVTDMDLLDEVKDAVSTLAEALMALLPNRDRLNEIMVAHYGALQFPTTETVDLFDFCARVMTGVQDRRAQRAAEYVTLLLRRAIVLSKTRGPELELAHGISIYLPKGQSVPPLYRLLDFPKECRWADFLDAYAAAMADRRGDANEDVAPPRPIMAGHMH